MKAWHLVLALSFTLLSGCLVTFKEPIAAHETAPAGLLGKWTSKDAWGEARNLQITRAGANQYKAHSYIKGNKATKETYGFTASRHGNRWYVSAAVPQAYGSNYTIAGFDLTDDHELVVYTLDLERLEQAIAAKELGGEAFDTREGQGLLVTSSLDKVFAYLDDSANSDVFVEVARFQRPAK
ncbi:hypothetical protein D3C84_166630 [compost metagenome]